jgi:hypothetical protein
MVIFAGGPNLPHSLWAVHTDTPNFLARTRNGTFLCARSIGTQFVGAELVGRLAEMLGKVAHHPQILTSGDLRVVATLEFFQHHLA